MARDRLAARRGQEGAQGGYGQAPQQGYPTSQPSYPAQSQSYGQIPEQRGPGGFTQPAPTLPTPQNPNIPRYEQPQYAAPQQQYGGQGQQQYAAPSQPYGQQQGGQIVDDETAFFNEIEDIQKATRELNDNISRIGELHTRQLGAVANEQEHSAVTQHLSALTQDTRSLSNNLKKAIKRLESQTAKRDPRDPNTNVRKQQIGAIKSRFMEAIQRYQTVEQDSRKKHKQRMERQYKIVKPDATQEEVSAAIEDNMGSGGNRIFEQALLNSNRYGDARAAYKEVQDRHQEILKIESTITELAQMFNDMATMVDEQEPALLAVEAKANEAETTMQDAEKQMGKAVKSARAARKKRWICFIIILIILAAVAIGLAVHFTQNK